MMTTKPQFFLEPDPKPESRRLTQKFTTLSLHFDLPLLPRQIPQWRGAVAQAAGWGNDLFHNHLIERAPLPESLSKTSGEERAEGYCYRYPLIHYRVRRGKAGLWAVNRGAEAARDWILQFEGKLQMGGRPTPLRITYLKEQEHELSVLPQMRCYRLSDYLAFNSENYQKWRKAADIFERMQLLQDVLTGHILGFATAMDWQIPERLEVRLFHLKDARPVSVHGSRRMAFNLLFKTNAALPAGIALGRSVSFGFGSVQPTRNQEG